MNQKALDMLTGYPVLPLLISMAIVLAISLRSVNTRIVRRLIPMVVVVLLAILGAFYLRDQRPRLELVPMVNVPVLARAVNAGEVISDSDLLGDTERLPIGSLPSNVLLRKDEIVNKLALTAIDAHKPIKLTDVSDYLRVPVLNTAVRAGDVITQSFITSRTVALMLLTSGSVLTDDDLEEKLALQNLERDKLIQKEQIADLARIYVPREFIPAGTQLAPDAFKLKNVDASRVTTDTLVTLDNIEQYQPAAHLLANQPVLISLLKRK